MNGNDSEVNDLFLWSKFKRRKRKEYGSCGVLQLTSFVLLDSHENQRFSRNDIGKNLSSRGAERPVSRVRNCQGGEPCRADTFIANWSRQRRVESSRASEPEVAKNIANGCEMSDCFL